MGVLGRFGKLFSSTTQPMLDDITKDILVGLKMSIPAASVVGRALPRASHDVDGNTGSICRIKVDEILIWFEFMFHSLHSISCRPSSSIMFSLAHDTGRNIQEYNATRVATTFESSQALRSPLHLSSETVNNKWFKFFLGFSHSRSYNNQRVASSALPFSTTISE